MKKKKNDLELFGIIGNVKSVEEKTYYLVNKFGEIKKGKLKESCLTSYNENGYILNYISQSKNLYVRQINNYDSDGKLIEQSLYNLDGSLDYRSTYKYDLNGNLIDYHYDESEGNYRMKINFKYDSMGNRIGENFYNSDGSLEREHIFKYDSKGKETEFYSYSNGYLNTKSICTYDLNGNLIENNYYDSKGNLCRELTNTYDSEGNKIEHNDYNSKGNIQENIIYDLKGSIIEWNNYNSKGNLYLKKTFKHNTNGDIIEKYSYSPKENLCDSETCEYEFDERNNWTKNIILKRKRGSKIIIRKITYYGEMQEIQSK